MDPSQDSYDGLNAAYMNMLNRNIPGVGNNPLIPTTTTTAATKPTHLTNKTKDITTATAATPMTQNQRHAIDTLQEAIKDALYISEGEEPYKTVHITTTTATGATALKTTTSFPTEQEFVTLLHTTRLLPSFQQQQQQSQEDEDEENTCEKSSNLQSILNKSNPGSDKLAKALQDVFGYSSPSTEANATTTTAAATTAPKDDKMVLYRVADPSSSTKVHIWVLGWIDNDLIGLHTISIES